mmetsp:Transcript_56622/g.137528  ORF Transcript_56622/g.137528 Transcript_56622/m.137528 type:complete len:206 (-) Transcript_56622:240-857(-)
MRVALKHMFFRSPRGTCFGFCPSSNGMGVMTFSIGTDSPVRAASAEAMFWTSIIRRSAGIRSPSPRTTTSPGTISPAGTLVVLLSRIQTASDESIAFNASAACSAEPSWMIPIIVLIMMTPKMIPTWIQFWTGSPTLAMADTAEMMATKTRIPTRTLLTCFQIFWRSVSFSFSVNLFSPYFSSRALASAVVNPVFRMSSPTSSCL